MRNRLLLVLVPAALGLACAGCETTKLFQGDPAEQLPEASDWQSTEPLTVPSFEVLWERARAILEIEGYDLDDERTRFDRNVMVTRWLTRLAPNRFEGIRRRAHVTFTAAGTSWVVHAAILRQRNADIDDPTNPARAEWEAAGTDTTRTALVVFKIRAAFDPALIGADIVK